MCDVFASDCSYVVVIVDSVAVDTVAVDSVAAVAKGASALRFCRGLQCFRFEDLAALLNNVEAVYLEIFQLVYLPA